LSYNNIKTIENISHLKKLKKLYLLSNKIKKVITSFIQIDSKLKLSLIRNVRIRF